MRSRRACLGWGMLLFTAAGAAGMVLPEDSRSVTGPIDTSCSPPAGVMGDDARPFISRADLRGAPIYSNSGNLADPFMITRPGAGCLQRDVTDVQTALGLLGLGFNCRTSGSYAVADDFIVPTGHVWTIDQVVLYLYQQGVVTPSISAVDLRLQTSSPLGQLIPPLTGYVPSVDWSNAQKNEDIDDPNAECSRRIQECVVTLAPPYVASAGTHYLIWQASGFGTSGPWAPPVVIPGATHKPGANALQAWSGTEGRFAPIIDSGTSQAPQDLVFVLRGAITGAAYPGDLNCDGLVDYADINPFVLALQSQATYAAQYPDCRWLNADTDGDGHVTYADIDVFVGLLAGVPPRRPGDLNCDGVVDYADINPFVLALSSPAGYQSQFPNCNRLNADINGDGSVDYADINPFVALLSGH